MIGALVAKYAALGLGVALAAAMVLAGVQTVRLAVAQTELAEVEGEHAAERVEAERTARIANENYRAEEARRAEAHRKAADEAAAIVAHARADARTADLALQRATARVRQLTAAAAASRPAALDPIAARVSPAPEPAADLFADVFSRIGQAAGRIARYADDTSAAGFECERRYDALTAGGSS